MSQSSMKLTDLLERKINEAKQTGVLYHYTSKEGLKNILKSNKLLASEENYMGHELHFVSFTRNKNFHKRGNTFHVRTDVRIAIDGNKLSNRYKISPFAYRAGWDYTENWEYDWLDDEPDDVVRNFLTGTGEYDEQEERIWFKKPNMFIGNIKDYIISIDKLK